MKKLISILLAVLLLASLSTAALAEDNILDIDIMGIRMDYPAEFSELQGFLSPNPNGIIAYDPNVYYMSFDYFSMPVTQFNELMNKPDEEFTQEDADTYLAAEHPIGLVLACVGGIENALSVFGLEEVPDGMEYTELAAVDSLCFYYLSADESSGDDLTSPYTEEFRMLQDRIPELLKNAEFYTPVDPVGELVGQTITFETTDLDGNPVTSAELFAQNEITMINYWGTWCHNCVDEMAELAEIHTRLQEKGCGIIGILQDGDIPEKLALAKEIMAEKGTNYPNVFLSESMVFLDDVSSFPTSFFVDSDGKIVTYPISGAYVEKYEGIIDSLLAGESTGGVIVPTAAANDAGAYRITVIDTEGNPVKGVAIQFCDDSTCNLEKTDANGVASFDLPEGTQYEVHVLKVPEGYEKTSDEFRTLDVYSDLVIVLNAAA